jgi:hypothetical protein
MMDKSLYSWSTSNFMVQSSAVFLNHGTFIRAFNWHEIPHLGLSIDGAYFSISTEKTKMYEDTQNLWRMCEIKTIPLFLAELQNVHLDISEVKQAFEHPIQDGETCLVPLKSLLVQNDKRIDTLSDLLKHLESENLIQGYHANGLNVQEQGISLLAYNKSDVLAMISNKFRMYETGK